MIGNPGQFGSRSKFLRLLSSQVKAAIIQETGLTLSPFSLERDLARHVKLTLTTYSIATIRQFVVDSVDQNLTLLKTLAKSGAMVEWDYRDDIFKPTQGAPIRLSICNIRILSLGSSRDSTQTIQFIKATASTTFLQSVVRHERPGLGQFSTRWLRFKYEPRSSRWVSGKKTSSSADERRFVVSIPLKTNGFQA